MKALIALLLICATTTSFADCSKNKKAGMSLIIQALSEQLDGTAIYANLFDKEIFQDSKSVLLLSGKVDHHGRMVTLNGRLNCNPHTDEYEFAGASVSGL